MDPDKNGSSKISMSLKMKALKRLDKGESVTNIATHLGIGKSTVCGWKVNREKIEEWCVEMRNRTLETHRRAQATLDAKVDQAVLTWFKHLRKNRISVTEPMLQRKALMYYQFLGGRESFDASECWLKNWRRRYGIEPLSASEKSYDANGIELFTKKLLKIIEHEQLTRDQVFNCDELSLTYNVVPPKTLEDRIERGLPAFEDDEEQVTVLACSNASGSFKLPLMVVGKATEPKVTQRMRKISLHVFYRNEENAWMNSQLFKDWFDMEFIPRVRRFLKVRGLPLKALLIIDDAASHQPLDNLQEGEMKTILLPSNVSAIQPMEQGVLESLKRSYRYHAMNSIVVVHNNDNQMAQHTETLKMPDVMFWLAFSWDKITAASIKISWHKIWPEEESGEEKQRKIVPKCDRASIGRFLEVFNHPEDCDVVDKDHFQQWTEHEDKDPLSDQEIISKVLKTMNDEESTAEVVTPEEPRKIHQTKDCSIVDKDNLQQWIHEKYDARDPLSDQNIISMKVEEEEKGLSCLLEGKLIAPTEVDDPHTIEGYRDVKKTGDESYQNRKQQKSAIYRAKKKMKNKAIDPLSSQQMTSIVMVDGVDEEDTEMESKGPIHVKVVTPAEARDGLELAISFFERQADTSPDGLLWLHKFRMKAESMNIQQKKNK